MGKYTKKDYLGALRELVSDIEAKHSAEVKAIYVGGSVARGDFIPGRSDIDVYVVLRGGDKNEFQKLLEAEARRIEAKHFEDLKPVLDEVIGVTVTTVEEIRNGKSFLGKGFEYHNFVNSGKLLFGEDVKELIPKPTLEEERELARNALNQIYEMVQKQERRVKWFRWIPLKLVPKVRREQMTRQAFSVIFRTASVWLCSDGVYVSGKRDIVKAFWEKCPQETELCEIVSEALKLWEKWAVAGLAGKETKWLFNNALKLVKELQRLWFLRRQIFCAKLKSIDLL
ncbi:nucleotidyltransferase domain-containing protein [Candidatus Bathyarchaeota archaeon]|nr:nucleotidyltransferase domain-containing protein [Candidatus Bathyarchaeota archaeon]